MHIDLLLDKFYDKLTSPQYTKNFEVCPKNILKNGILDK